MQQQVDKALHKGWQRMGWIWHSYTWIAKMDSWKQIEHDGQVCESSCIPDGGRDRGNGYGYRYQDLAQVSQGNYHSGDQYGARMQTWSNDVQPRE